MKSVIAITILWLVPQIILAAEQPATGQTAVTRSEIGQPEVLWEECNMEADQYGVQQCYRLFSDLTEQTYYFMANREYSDYPVVAE